MEESIYMEEARLKEKYCGRTIDGVFGAKTKKAIKEFQMTADGVWGQEDHCCDGSRI